MLGGDFLEVDGRDGDVVADAHALQKRPTKRVVGVVICTMKIESTRKGRARCIPARRVMCLRKDLAMREPKRPPKGMMAMSSPWSRLRSREMP